MNGTASKPENIAKDQVTSLYNLMKSENLYELEIKENNFYLYIKRKTAQDAVLQQVMQVPVYEALQAQQAAQKQAVEAEPAVSGLMTVKSPIMGIFYQAPSPTSPVFVKEGDVVSAGKTLCIVEAMKVMNEIKAEHSMKIVKILVENGKPIAATQDLFLVEKA